MRRYAQAVVIGGGLVGCSILYHLAKLGWTDVILLERDELTSGSTWHAAANIHGLHDSTNISRIQHYTMNLYKQLEAETGQGCGVFQPGSLYLAQTEEREHQLRLQAAKQSSDANSTFLLQQSRTGCNLAENFTKPKPQHLNFITDLYLQ